MTKRGSGLWCDVFYYFPPVNKFFSTRNLVPTFKCSVFSESIVDLVNAMGRSIFFEFRCNFRNCRRNQKMYRQIGFMNFDFFLYLL